MVSNHSQPILRAVEGRASQHRDDLRPGENRQSTYPHGLVMQHPGWHAGPSTWPTSQRRPSSPCVVTSGLRRTVYAHSGRGLSDGPGRQGVPGALETDTHWPADRWSTTMGRVARRAATPLQIWRFGVAGRGWPRPQASLALSLSAERARPVTVLALTTRAPGARGH